jgi:hypothetical protein
MDSVPVNVSFDAPQKPSAYAIRLELKESNGRTVSLYRSRIVVKGENPRIRKMAVDSYYYKAGDNGSVMLVVGPSPDHYTNPVTTNAKVTVSIFADGEIVYSGSSVISSLSSLSYPVMVFQSYNYTASKELNFFEVCSQLESSEGMLFDRYCYVINSTDFNLGKCGDGFCVGGEDQVNCCEDCGCSQSGKCEKNVCQAGPAEVATTVITTQLQVEPTLPRQPKTSDNSIGYFFQFALFILLAVLLFVFVKKLKNKKGEIK